MNTKASGEGVDATTRERITSTLAALPYARPSDDSGPPAGNIRDRVNLHANDTPREGVSREPQDISRGALMHRSRSPAESKGGCHERDADHESQVWGSHSRTE